MAKGKELNMHEEGKILIPVDFAPCSQIAVSYGVNYAKVSRAEAVLLYVLEDNTEFDRLILSEQNEKISARIYERMKEWIQTLFGDDADYVSFRIETGKVYERVLDLTKQEKVSRVVMGINGSTQPKANYLGSNVQKVIASVKAPVITLRQPTALQMQRRLVLPLDLSRHFHQQIETTIAILKSFTTPYHLFVLSITNETDDFQINRLAQHLNETNRILSQAEITFSSELVKTDSMVESISEVILDYGRKMAANLLLVSSQPDHTLSKFYLSPLLQELLSVSDIPVMTVSPLFVPQTTS